MASPVLFSFALNWQSLSFDHCQTLRHLTWSVNARFQSYSETITDERTPKAGVKDALNCPSLLILHENAGKPHKRILGKQPSSSFIGATPPPICKQIWLFQKIPSANPRRRFVFFIKTVFHFISLCLIIKLPYLLGLLSKYWRDRSHLWKNPFIANDSIDAVNFSLQLTSSEFCLIAFHSEIVSLDFIDLVAAAESWSLP